MGQTVWREYGIRACGRQCSGCQSVEFNSYKLIGYSQVCGRVTGYQKGSPVALRSMNSNNNINQDYVDGVSKKTYLDIHGSSLRKFF